MLKVGIIGGSGLDNPEIVLATSDVEVETRYGAPSSPLRVGTWSGVDVVVIARHGREHTIPPSQVNYRANIQALKDASCTHIIATTAVGSLRADIGRGDLVVLDQFIDFTRRRINTFHESFAPHKPVHAPMADPFDGRLRSLLSASCMELDLRHHERGTVATIEGPRFSTRAESRMFRSWGADVINMSIANEAALANEAGIPYAAIAMATDFDSWKEDEMPVTWQAVLEIFAANVKNVTNVLGAALFKLRAPDIMSTLPLPVAVDRPLSVANFIKEKIRTIPNWPKPGIMFRDITTLLKDAAGFGEVIRLLAERYGQERIDVVAGIESRGFIIGAALAQALGVGFVPIRKKGKLPAATLAEEYALEYGFDIIEIHADAINSGQRVVLADDLIATGGTALAASRLLRELGAEIIECVFVIDLPDLGGRARLEAAGLKSFCLAEFEGE